MAAVWLLVVLAQGLLMDTGLCVPVEVKQDESNAHLKQAKVELDDQASHNVSNIQHQNVIFIQLNNSLSQQQSYNMSNTQQESYNISNNPAAPVEPDRASHNVSNTQQQYVIFNQLNNSFSQPQQSYNMSNVLSQQSHNKSNTHQSEIQPLTSSSHNDKMDDVGSPEAEFVVNV
ncbi:uncharacterized protein LOC144005044 [Festucalex cinctus]